MKDRLRSKHSAGLLALVWAMNMVAPALAADPVAIHRGTPLEVNVPSLPADAPQAEVVDKNVPVALTDVQLQSAFTDATTPPTATSVSPKILRVAPSESAAGLPALSKLRGKTNQKPAKQTPAPQSNAEEPAVIIHSPYEAPATLAEVAAPPAVTQEALVPIPPVAESAPPPPASEPAAPLAQVPAYVPPQPVAAPQLVAVEQVPAQPEQAFPALASAVAAVASTLPLPVLPAPIIIQPSASPMASMDAAAFASLTPAAGTPSPVQQLDTSLAVPELKALDPGAPVLPMKELSKESKQVLARTPSQIDTPKKSAKKKAQSVEIDRTKDVVDTMADAGMDIRSSHEAMGLKLEVRQSRLDLGTEIENAYAALAAGQVEMAIALYQRALDVAPGSLEAKVGLATAYHRSGQLDKARSLYAEVLKQDPDNREALNNFLGLVGEEAPDDALAKLNVLMGRNPNFSAIPAQMATILMKKGDFANATEALMRATALSPENLPYQFNLAVALDKQGRREEAASVYARLVQAHMRGETIPADIRAVQERLTFLRSNSGVK